MTVDPKTTEPGKTLANDLETGGQHLVQASVGELLESMSKWTYYMELVHIYAKFQRWECAGTCLMQTPMGPSQNIFLTEMRDLISALVTDCSLDPYVGHYIQNITIAMQSGVVHR